eukprot:5832963-Amphidinium_carterae.1
MVVRFTHSLTSVCACPAYHHDASGEPNRTCMTRYELLLLLWLTANGCKAAVSSPPSSPPSKGSPLSGKGSPKGKPGKGSPPGGKKGKPPVGPKGKGAAPAPVEEDRKRTHTHTHKTLSQSSSRAHTHSIFEQHYSAKREAIVQYWGAITLIGGLLQSFILLLKSTLCTPGANILERGVRFVFVLRGKIVCGCRLLCRSEIHGTLALFDI